MMLPRQFIMVWCAGACQELANTAWALASLAHNGAPPFMATLLASSRPHLPRFLPQVSGDSHAHACDGTESVIIWYRTCDHMVPNV